MKTGISDSSWLAILEWGTCPAVLTATPMAQPNWSQAYCFLSQKIQISPTTPAMPAAKATRMPSTTRTNNPPVTQSPMSTLLMTCPYLSRDETCSASSAACSAADFTSGTATGVSDPDAIATA